MSGGNVRLLFTSIDLNSIIMVKFGSLAVLLAAGVVHALEPCAEVTNLFKKSQASNCMFKR